MNTIFQMVAKTFFGFEDILSKELLELGGQDIKKGNRIVYFKGDKGFLYKSNLCLRTALKILKPIQTLTINNTDDLYRAFYNFSWEEYMDNETSFVIDSVVFGNVFTHSQYVSQKAKDGIVDKFRDKTGSRPNVNLENPDLKINIHITENICTISLDSSGNSLHQRGYRTDTNIAPLNEVLASGIIKLTEWDKKTDFLDPMCGSGTILIEAAMIAANIPANINRENFAFKKWLDWDSELFELIKLSQEKKIKSIDISIKGFDKSPSAIIKARENIKNANLDKYIDISKSDFFQMEKEGIKLLHLVTNPPYGHRLKGDINAIYQSIGDSLKLSFPDTNAWMITSNFEAMKHIGLRPSRKIKLFNGKLETRLLFFPIYDGTKRSHKSKQ
jgi:putative N6-adenine-specific DNA methylase